MDTLVLGCTHYPLIKPAIQETVGPEIRLVDSAESCADYVRARLRKLHLLRASGQGGGRIYPFVTDEVERFEETRSAVPGCPDRTAAQSASGGLRSRGLERGAWSDAEPAAVRIKPICFPLRICCPNCCCLASLRPPSRPCRVITPTAKKAKCMNCGRLSHRPVNRNERRESKGDLGARLFIPMITSRSRTIMRKIVFRSSLAFIRKLGPDHMESPCGRQWPYAYIGKA